MFITNICVQVENFASLRSKNINFLAIDANFHESPQAPEMRVFGGNPSDLCSFYLRSSFALPPYQSRCKVGAKSVREGRNNEFGTEGERKKSELSNAKTQNHKVLFEKGNRFI